MAYENLQLKAVTDFEFEQSWFLIRRDVSCWQDY